ncbi:MAG: hypothetical protein HY795_06655 [Desulfovibrio sp.]|nr:hypothetical protein [Desulfovibrio sp.]MBI4961220.1 hypothetical protein [Desulfovibrio sp.]
MFARVPPMLLAVLLVASVGLACAQSGKGSGMSADAKAKLDAICARTDVYGCYANSKYGYTVAWPKKLLTAQEEADDGGGKMFTSRDDKASMACWAYFNNVVPPLQKGFQEALKEPGLQVTYKHMGPDFFVVSGIRDGNIFYRKTVKGKEAQASFELTYHPSLKEAFDPVVGDVAKSLIMH